MRVRGIACTFGSLLVVLGFPVQTYSQELPPAPQPPVLVPARPYVPLTIVVDLDAVKEQFLQELRELETPPPRKPIFIRRKGRLFKGRLLERLRERRPLRKLMIVLGRRLESIKELEKLREPAPLGNDQWLSLNLKEVVFREVVIAPARKQAVIYLAVDLQPTIVISKTKPPTMRMPQVSLANGLPPPNEKGTPIGVVLKIDPKSLPAVLPADAQKELAKYGIDSTKIKFAQQIDKKGRKLVVAVPIKKPIETDLKVWFSPEINKNVLSFKQPGCAIDSPASGKKESSFNQTLRRLTENTIRSFVVGKMKTAQVDFGPHLKKITNPAVKKKSTADKVRANIAELRVDHLSAERNHLVLYITGVIAKEGIVILAP